MVGSELPDNHTARLETMTRLSPCDFADALPVESFIDPQIACLWAPVPKIVGRVFTVECPLGDHLMFHAAIYRAQPGDIIVAKGDPAFALAGGNVCQIAQSRGIIGCVVDGCVRDLAEIRDMAFPVFARGVIPKPAVKKQLGKMREKIRCGNTTVQHGDYCIADEEGIVIIPQSDIDEVLDVALARSKKDACVTLEQWQENHQMTVEKKLRELGFRD